MVAVFVLVAGAGTVAAQWFGQTPLAEPPQAFGQTSLADPALVVPTTMVAPPIPDASQLASSSAPGITVIPAQNFDLPDPMFLSEGGRYYAFFSSAFGDPYLSNVPELILDRAGWTRSLDAFPRVPVWAESRASGGGIWDPYVIKAGQRYLMYFSAQLNHDYTDPAVAAALPIHCLGVAVGYSPLGPFTAVPGPPIVCQQSLGGDIDIQPFLDPAGPNGPDHPWYVLWKSDQNNLVPKQTTAIWAAGLSNDGLSLTTAPQVIFEADQPWEGPVLEAPQMVVGPDGKFWLFFSAGTGFFTADYRMGVAECFGPLGPCSSYDRPPLVQSNTQGSGPGEETVFVAPDHSYWLLYNPWHTGLPFLLYRPAEGVRVAWDGSGPYVAPAGTFPSP